MKHMKGEITQVAAGRDHSLILVDGKVFAFGANDDDQVGSDTGGKPWPIEGIENKIVAIGCGSSFSTALDDNGNLYGWGSNEDGQLGQSEETSTCKKPIIIASDVKQFSCGYHHICVITNDGKIMTAGENEFGNLGRDGNQYELGEVDNNVFGSDFSPKESLFILSKERHSLYIFTAYFSKIMFIVYTVV